MADIFDLAYVLEARSSEVRNRLCSIAEQPAEIIIFPGVRYERTVHGPTHLSGKEMLDKKKSAIPATIV